MSQENVEIARRGAQPRTAPPMKWTTLSTILPTDRKARPIPRTTVETPFPIPLKGWIMNRILILEPKWQLSGWLASDLRDGGTGAIRWFLSWDAPSG
jgi:hypothetical protein